jgi:hypothetical protein
MKSDWEEQSLRQYVQAGTDKNVCLDGAGCGLVELTVDVVKEWLVGAAPRAVSECAAMDDTDVLLATDVTDDDDVCSVLDLTRYPEEAAAMLKSDTETARQQKEEAMKKTEEERLKAEAEAKKKTEEERLKAEAEAKKKMEDEAQQCRVAAAAAAVRAFRRRCLQAASAACIFVLLLLLHRAGRLPLRLQRLLAALLLWLRRR